MYKLTLLKSIFSGLQLHCWHYGSILFCLQICEITRNSEKIRTCSSRPLRASRGIHATFGYLQTSVRHGNSPVSGLSHHLHITSVLYMLHSKKLTARLPIRYAVLDVYNFSLSGDVTSTTVVADVRFRPTMHFGCEFRDLDLWPFDLCLRYDWLWCWIVPRALSISALMAGFNVSIIVVWKSSLISNASTSSL